MTNEGCFHHSSSGLSIWYAFSVFTLRSPSPRLSPSGRGRSRHICVPKGVLNEVFLFLLVAAVRAGSGGGRSGSSNSGEGEPVKKAVTKQDPQVRPCSHIGGLLLDPKNRRAVAVGRQG